MKSINMIKQSKLKYYPPLAYGEMEAYTYYELGKRPYKYQKGMYKAIKTTTDTIGIKVCKKPVYTIKVVV